MTLRRMLRWWLALLRPTAVAVPRALALPAPAPLAYRYRSIEALMLLPTVTPDRTEYQRPDCGSLDAVMVWMVYERSDGWWETPTHDVRHAAVAWTELRTSLGLMAVPS